jgi:hypothetical protein
VLRSGLSARRSYCVGIYQSARNGGRGRVVAYSEVGNFLASRDPIGTFISERASDRSVRARLRIRLL